MSWRMARPFILRSAGFPAKLMDEINMPEAAQATDAALACEAAQGQMAADLGESLRVSFSQRRDSALRWKTAQKAFQKGRAFTAEELAACEDDAQLHARLSAWNAAVLNAADAQAHAASVFERELQGSRRALRALVANERFREAVFLSSPHMYEAGLQRFLASPLQPERCAEDKRTERQLVMYLQRVCTKNETTSFFGPIGYGRFGVEAGARPDSPRASAAWPVSWQQQTELGRRETFMAYWAVEALAAALAELPCVRLALKPQMPRSFKRMDKRTLFAAAQNKTVTLPSAWADLLDHVEQGDSVAALLQRHDPAVLETLEKRGLLKTSIGIPINETRTLEYLVCWVDALPADAQLLGWRTGLHRLLALKADFAGAGLDHRPGLLAQAAALFTSLNGLEAQRAAGKIYADRSLFYEECRSGHDDVLVSAEFSHLVETRLAGLLDVFARHALERRAFLETLGADVFRQLFGLQAKRVPFLHFVKEALAAEQAQDWVRSLREFRSSVQHAVLAHLNTQADGSQRCVALPQSVLQAPPAGKRPHNDLPLLASPDIMLARQPGGEPLLILGEVHDTLMLWGWALKFHEAGPALADEMHGFASALQLHRVLNVVGSNRKKIIPFEYPGRTAEFRTSAGGSNPSLAMADLHVVFDGGCLQLRAGDDPTPLALHNGELPTLCHALFALPRCVPFDIDLGEHTPRIVVEGTVLQRERWRVSRAGSGLLPSYPGTSFELFRDMRRLRRRLGLPERVFLKSPAEPKPVFIDFRCQLLLEAWDALFPPESSAILSEMLPDVEQLWLTNLQGEPVTAELRTAFGRAPDVPTPATLELTEYMHV